MYYMNAKQEFFMLATRHRYLFMFNTILLFGFFSLCFFIFFFFSSRRRHTRCGRDWSSDVCSSDLAPQHYDVWVDYLFLETTGIRAWRIPQGWVSCCWKSPRNTVSGGGTPLPNYVVIRWFSYAERKFYGRQIRLPDDLEQRMRQKTPYRLGNGSIIERPRYNLILGLAPGGQIVVWIMNQARNAEEIMRVQAFELEGNPEHYQVRLRNYEQEHGTISVNMGFNMKVGKRWARPLYRRILLALTLTLTTGCDGLGEEPLKWYIGAVAPKHYDVWVDYLFLETTGIRA